MFGNDVRLGNLSDGDVVVVEVVVVLLLVVVDEVVVDLLLLVVVLLVVMLLLGLKNLKFWNLVLLKLLLKDFLIC